MIKKIIGIGHKARQGKDTLAQFLKNTIENHYSINCEILHFADPLKKEVSNLTKIPLIQYFPEADVYGLLNKMGSRFLSYDFFDKEQIPELHKFMLARNNQAYWTMEQKDPILLQIWGTNYRRAFYGSDYWINKTFDIIKKFKDKETLIIIPDTRFKNELDAIREKNGMYIRVERLTSEGLFRDPNRDPNHPSETSLDGISGDLDISIQDGDLIELEKQAVLISEKIKMWFKG